MKKIVLSMVIVLSVAFNTYAQGGGLFRYGAVSDEEYYGSAYWALDENDRTQGLLPGLPGHGSSDNMDAPLGEGMLLLLGLGAAYAYKKRRDNE